MYKNYGWTSWEDFLGYKKNIANQNKIYKSFKDSRKYVRKIGIKSISEWRNYCKSGKKPSDIPAAVHSVYKNKGWVSWGDFFGTGTIAVSKIKYRSFKKARIFVRKLGLINRTEWDKYCKSGKKPSDIPAAINSVYKDKGFISLEDFLGVDKKKLRLSKYISFVEAKLYARELKLKYRREWYHYVKTNGKPDNIPRNVDVFYKEGWKSWADFLGRED